MKNINLIQVESNRDHWIVKADTRRFGVQAVMFEGDYDTAIGFIGQNVFQAADRFTVNITGEHEGHVFNNDWVTIHSNGYIEQDWTKVF